MGNGVVLNNTGMILDELIAQVEFRDENNVLLDYVLVPVLTLQGEAMLPANSKGEFSYRHLATDWHTKVDTYNLNFFNEGTMSGTLTGRSKTGIVRLLR